ncbi:methyltransferase [Kitasatospora sp. NPDC001664]
MHTAATPALAMLRLLGGFQLSQAVYVVARAGLADQLLDGERTVAQLAAATGLRADPLARIVRVLAGQGVFTLDPATGLVGLGPLGRTLVTGAPESVRGIAVMWMETHYPAFAELWQTAETGGPAADHLFGMPYFAWLAQDPEKVATFTAAMTDFARAIRQDAFSAVELDGARTVVDVGGADGAVLAALARRYPRLRGTVFDLPHVVAAAPPLLRAAGVDDRITAVGGDFFVEVPSADCYVAGFILHDWSDGEAARILSRVHEAAAVPHARLVLVETVLDRGEAPEVAALLDLTMLGMLTGRERSGEEWRVLLEGAGFRLDRIRETGGPMCVIEATRVP